MFQLGKSIARSDFRRIFKNFSPEISSPSKENSSDDLTNNIEKAFLLPHLVTHYGWGRLNILTDSDIHFNKKRKIHSFSIICEVESSFESSSWIIKERESMKEDSL